MTADVVDIDAQRRHARVRGEELAAAAHAKAQPPQPEAPHRELHEGHVSNLRLSGLNDESISLSGVYTETDPAALAKLFNAPKWNMGDSALVFPCFVPGACEPYAVRLRPSQPPKGGPKYLSANGAGQVVYYTPRARAGGWYADTSRTLHWTEGEKKSLAFDQLELCCVGLVGIYGFHDVKHKNESKRWRLGELIAKHVAVAGRDHVIVFDWPMLTGKKDDGSERDELAAARRLAECLTAAGAKSVRVICSDDPDLKGFDDYYARKGEADARALLERAVDVPPKKKREKKKADTSEPAYATQLSDLGNAERLVKRDGDKIHFCPEREKWLVWDERRWAWDKTNEVERYAKQTVRGIYAEAAAAADKDHAQELAEHAIKSESASRIKAVVTLAKTESGIPVTVADLDANAWQLNAHNGTIDLRTGALLPHRREDLHTKLAGAEYIPSSHSPLWENCLHTWTKGDRELGGYLQRMAGCALIGAVLEKLFWFLFGLPDGMKSTFIDAIMGALGDYAVAADFTTWLVQSNTGGNRDDLVSLLGARLVTSAEVRKGARFDEAVLKRVTGGDPIKASAKFETLIEFKPTFALWLAGNDAPIIRDDDEGAWSRVRRVPFTNPLPKAKQDPRMREKLAAPDVRAAVLAWAVQGCLKWQREGLGACKAVEQSTTAYRSEMDRIAGFLESECVFDAATRTATKTFFEAYENWCSDNGVKPMSGKDIAARLAEHGVKRSKRNGVRWYEGVGVRGDWTPEGTAGSEGVSRSLRGGNAHIENKSSLDLLSLADPAVHEEGDFVS